MTRSTLAELLDRRPFHPFTVRLANGDAHELRYPNSASLTKSNLVIADSESERMIVCAIAHVARVELAQVA